jgi:fumarate hydratase subunit alpha
MKEILSQEIIEQVKKLCISSNYELPQDVIKAIKAAKEKEESPVARSILDQLLENASIASKERIPICQDTGFSVFFVEIGDDVKVKNGSLKEAITEGVRQGYKEGYLRKSICHPFSRKNTLDNTPPIIHFDIVSGDHLKIIMAPKGGGSENMSRVTMLKPSDGKEGIVDFVVNRVRESGANPCPPIIVGVGIGGTFEMAGTLAKRALLREIGSKNQDPELSRLEEIIFNDI